MSSIKDKTIKGVIWGSINNFSNQGIQFIISVILARLLTPQEFGLVGMLTIFITISDSFINSGLGSALIRKKDCTKEDYSTVFYFNLIVGLFFYFVLFFSSNAIAQFFNEPQLESLVKVLGLILIINAFTIIQGTIITKRVDFKLYAKISVIAGTCSGFIAIILAIYGFGVWSLVARSIAYSGLHSLLLWYWNSWRPSLIFSKSSFKDLFGFGVNLLGSSIIGKLSQNLNTLVIGKFFSAAELGFYTRADSFKNIPSQNINTIISKVSYPILSQIKDEPERLKNAYRNLILVVTFLSFILMSGLAAVAEPFIITLIGEKWRSSILFLQMLCVPGMLYPLQALNLNMLNVQGKSNLYLRLTIIKSLLRIPFIIFGILMGINYLVGGMIVLALIEYYINSYYSGRFINYSIKEQLIDILPTLLLSFLMFFLVWFVGKYLTLNSYAIILLIQSIIGLVFVIIYSEIARLKSYLLMKNILIIEFKKLKPKF